MGAETEIFREPTYLIKRKEFGDVISPVASATWIPAAPGSGTGLERNFPTPEPLGVVRTFVMQQPQAANTNRRIRILIVEDNPVDLKMIEKSCEKYGLKCDLLHMDDGAELVRYLREVDADPDMELPDIALLDVHLPNYDGVELVDRIKASKRCGHIPVILMSNTLRPEDRELVENVANRFFEKAVDYDAFMKIGAIIQEELTH